MNNFDDEVRKIEIAKEEKAQLFFKKLTSKIPLIIALGIAVWWIFYGTVKITSTTLSLTDRIGLTICTIVLAITYCSLISDGGFRSAKQTEYFIKVNDEYESAVKKGNAFKKEINKYAYEIAVGNLKECRKNNLEANGIEYEDIFDEDGKLILVDYKKDPRYSRKQKKVIRKCVCQRIILPSIFGNISSKYFGLKREISQKEYTAKTTLTKTITRTIVSIVSVGIMFEFVGFSWGSFIYAVFQIVMWTASGYVQRLKNYDFVIDELIPQLKEKILIITGYLELKEIQESEVKENGE